MNSGILNFIEDNKELFQASDWNEIYKRLINLSVQSHVMGTKYYGLDIGEFSSDMIELGMDPIRKGNMTIVPWAYLRHVKKPFTYTLPSQIKEINTVAFLRSGLEEININEGCEVIGGSAFEDCRNLTSINIPASVRTIREYALASCKNLSEINFLGNNLTSIWEYGLAYNPSLERIKLPEGLQKLGNMVFFKNKELKEVSLPNTLQHIGEHCFFGDTNLTNLEMNFNLVVFGREPFYDCPNLTTITHRGPKKDILKLGWHIKKRWRKGSSLTKIICDDGEIELV